MKKKNLNNANRLELIKTKVADLTTNELMKIYGGESEAMNVVPPQDPYRTIKTRTSTAACTVSGTLTKM